MLRVKTHARLGQAVHGTRLGFSLAPTSEVSLEPYGEDETIGFRNAEVVKVSDRRELNFLLGPFLTASSGYKVALDRLKIHSVQIEGDDLVVDADVDLSVK